MHNNGLLNKFSKIMLRYPSLYQSSLPMMFDDTLTQLQKMNKLIYQAREVGVSFVELKDFVSDVVVELDVDISNIQNELDVFEQQMLNEYLPENIETVLNEMTADGRFESIIEGSVFVDFNNQLERTELKVDTLYVNAAEPQFGIVGDGETDDSQAIKDMHIYANTIGVGVKYPNKTYYLGSEARNIPIKTPTDFGLAHFIIDNAANGEGVFDVPSSNEWETVNVSSFNAIKNEFKLNTNYIPSLKNIVGQLEVIEVSYTVAGQLLTGMNRQQITEIFVHTQNGKIIGNIIHNVENFTSVRKRKLGVGVPLENGSFHFTGKLAQAFSYLFHINEDNTKPKNMRVTRDFTPDSVRKEVFQFNRAFNVGLIDITAYNPLMTKKPYPADDLSFEGYIFRVDYCTNFELVNFNNTTKHNADWNSTLEYATWGSMSSNQSKNIVIEKSYISRVDSHSPINGLTILDSYVDWVQICGTGRLYSNNTVFSASMNNVLIGFYSANTNNAQKGGQWVGDIILDNPVYKPIATTQNDFYLVGYTNTQYYAYRDYIPFVNMEINNLTIDMQNLENPTAARFAITRFAANDTSRGLNAYLPHSIKMDGLKYKGGKPSFAPMLPHDFKSSTLMLEKNSFFIFDNIVFQSEGDRLNISDIDILVASVLSPASLKLNVTYNNCFIPALSASNSTGNLDVIINNGEVNSIISNRAGVNHSGIIVVNNALVHLKSFNNAYLPLSLNQTKLKFNACRIYPYQINVGGGETMTDFLTASNTNAYCSNCYVVYVDVKSDDFNIVGENLYQLDNWFYNKGLSRFTKKPATATAPGRAGDWFADGSDLYVCIADNQWRKSTLTTF